MFTRNGKRKLQDPACHKLRRENSLIVTIRDPLRSSSKNGAKRQEIGSCQTKRKFQSDI